MALRKLTTRAMTSCPVFGTPAHLSEVVLPTYGDVMRYYLMVKNKLKPEKDSKEPSVADIAEQVAVEIEQVWIKSSIPFTSHTRVIQLLRAYHDKYMKLMKPYKGRKNEKSFQAKLSSFKEEAEAKLFDIAACKCILFTACH
jgi:hypothetical protein